MPDTQEIASNVPNSSNSPIPVESRSLHGFDTFAILEPVRSHLVGLIRNYVEEYAGASKFPGPNPCSIERADLRSLRGHKYWICDKTYGIRCLLVCLQYVHEGRAGNEPLKLAVLVTRSWELFLVKIDICPRVWRQGLVCDGELVKIDTQWTWLGFDAIIVSGVPVWKEPLSHRIQAARATMFDYRQSPGEIRITWKRYYDSMEEYMRTKNDSNRHPSDGVILTPEDDPVRAGRHKRLYKLKDGDKHTVDFLVTNEVDLSVYNPAIKGHVVVAKLTTALSAQADAGSHPLIAECAFADNQWTFVCTRTDKATANDMLTYNKTLVNIEEKLTLNDLVGVL